MQKLATLELLVDFAKLCAMASSLVGFLFVVTPFFLSDSNQQSMAIKIGGASLCLGAMLGGSALLVSREIEEELIIVIREEQKIMSEKFNKCRGCKYWHGIDSLVCAVHPEGVDGDFCIDFSEEFNQN